MTTHIGNAEFLLINAAWSLAAILAYKIGGRRGSEQRHKDISEGMRSLMDSGKIRIMTKKPDKRG